MSLFPRPKKRGRPPPPYGPRFCTFCCTKLKLMRLNPPVYFCSRCVRELREHG